MRRSALILLALIQSGVSLVWGGWLISRQVALMPRGGPIDDLEWLRVEFQVSTEDLARIRRLHEGYVPICRDYCQRIDTATEALLGSLSTPGSAAGSEARLIEIATLRARCQAAMLRHFEEVARLMPPEQGRRYLSRVQHIALGSHEKIEKSMASTADGHAHH